MECQESCDLFLSNVMLGHDTDLSSVSWNDFSLSPADDALFADVYLGTDQYEFNKCTFPIDPSTSHIDRTFVHENYLTDISLTSWDFLTMQPPPTTNPSIATLASRDSGEPSECVDNQTSSPRSINLVSPSMLSSRTHEVPPTQNAPERPAGVPNTPTRRTKMKPGTRPCDLKRQKRKENKPEKCHICQKGHQWRRDLERHYCTQHPDEAAKMGLSMSRPVCRHCGQDFARRDHLTRHLRRKHGG
jgi:hypothetical protein